MPDNPYMYFTMLYLRTPFIVLLLFLGLPLAAQQRLKISPNQRFLMQEDGTPFFYLGDTA